MFHRPVTLTFYVILIDLTKFLENSIEIPLGY